MGRDRDLRDEIAALYMEMVIQVGPEKVRILDIAKRLGINKNSYYYHFSSKYSVAYWIFRRDVARMLDAHFEPEHFVRLEVDEFASSKNRFPELPYYARVPSGARMLDHGIFFKHLVLCLRERQPFYRLMLQDATLDNLSSYMRRLYGGAFMRDIDIIADGRYIPPETQGFLSHSLLSLFMGMLDELVSAQELSPVLLDEAKNPFWNFAAESVNEAIRNHPITSGRLSFADIR